MIKRTFQLLCAAGLLAMGAVAAHAQSSAVGAPQQQPAAVSHPAQATTSTQPAPATSPAASGPNASAEACGGKFPEGGAPEYLWPEAKEKRTARIGTAEDPGCNPEPGKVFWRFGKAYTIDRYERMWANYETEEQGWIRPFGFANSYRELYQQNERYVWVWQLKPEENPEPQQDDVTASTTTSSRQFTPAEIDYLQYLRAEFMPANVASSTKTLRFEESSEGLPAKGSWRNELAVADMNGDGFPDIVAPPQRAGGTIPAIFLGDGKGRWQYWAEAKWPHDLDYGGVVAADFNRDGKMDLAFAVHLRGVNVFLGDNKGGFTEVTEGLPQNLGSRRIAVADIDGDKYPDLVVLAEGPTAARANQTTTDARFAAFLNRKAGTSWQHVEIAPVNARVAGDWLAIGNFNGDKVVDFSTANIYMGSVQTLFLSGGANKWAPADPQQGKLVPTLSYYMATAAGKFSSKKTDDAIVSFVRFWPSDVNPKLIPPPPTNAVSGIDRISFAGGKPKRTPIVRWGNKFGVSGLATADFDGDGNLDIVYTHASEAEKREIVVLLGDGKGGFTKASTEGLQIPAQVTYDINVSDVNGDGRPDIIMMWEADEATAFATRSGAIRVFLNRGEQTASH